MKPLIISLCSYGLLVYNVISEESFTCCFGEVLKFDKFVFVSWWIYDTVKSIFLALCDKSLFFQWIYTGYSDVHPAKLRGSLVGIKTNKVLMEHGISNHFQSAKIAKIRIFNFWRGEGMILDCWMLFVLSITNCKATWFAQRILWCTSMCCGRHPLR